MSLLQRYAIPVRPSEDVSLGLAMVVAAAVFAFSPWAPLSLVALAAVAGLAWLRLDFALALVPLFAPFFMLPVHLGSHRFAPSEAFLGVDVAVTAGLVAFRRLSPDWQALRRSPFLPPAILFLCAVGLSTILAVDRHNARNWFLIDVLEPEAFFALLLLVVKRPAQWFTNVLALIGAGITVGLMGFVQFVTHHGLSTVAGSPLGRISGPYGSPDNVGLLYDRVIPLWFSVPLLTTIRSRRSLIPILPALVLLPALFLTYSRGAWVAIPAAVAFMVVLVFPKWRLLGAILLLVVVAGALVKERAVISVLRTGHTGTVHTRVEIWQSALQMVRDHPLVGIGPDNFIHYYAPTRKQNLWQHVCSPGLGYIQADAGAEPCQSHPHNEILDLLLSGGIAGLLAFLWLEVVFWRLAIRAWHLHRNPAVLGIIGAMLASLLHGLVDNVYFLPDLAIIFWLLCATVSFLAEEPSATSKSSCH